MQTLNWREKFAGIFCFVIGLIILVLYIFDIITKRSSDLTAVQDNIQINRSALFLQLRILVAVIVSLTGGWLLLKQKRWGWVMTFTFLLLIAVIAGYFAFSMAILGMPTYSIFPALMLLLAVLSVVFLVMNSTREKFRVNNATWLSTLVFLMAIGAIFFFLQ